MNGKLAALLAALLLLSACTAASTREESSASEPAAPSPDREHAAPDREQSDPADGPASSRADDPDDGIVEVEVDPDLVVYADRIVHGPDLLEWPREQGRIANSYEIVGSASYLDRWTRDYEAYLPRFTDEIPYAGAAVIQAHYEREAERYREQMEEYLRREFAGGTLIDSPSFYSHYQYADYRVFFAGRYLSVVRDYDTYGGGAHNLYGSWVEMFDMTTGKQLEPLDILQTGWDAEELFEEMLERNADPNDGFYGYAYPIDESTLFYMAEEGLVFLFNPYVNGPFSVGRRQIVVPWEELAPLLRIEPPDAAS